MKWNCNHCGREIISEKEKETCLECWWKDLVEKTEINPETIRNFMERNWFTCLTFQKGEYWDVIQIEAKSRDNFFAGHYYPAGLVRLENAGQYWPRTKRNVKKNFFGKETYSECSAFLEKLFYFAQTENIKRIVGDWRAEKNPNNETLFKVDDLIIEKKTAAEIEKEE